ncbi:PTS sugar transporter subunit IIA [Aerococcus urinaeequi]|uniref:PTS sugar transporter subunit IIA n=1 Tax=Aerococcus urinaeequi TaxID=51665 RepID=UPI000845E8E4|nr:PTS sugar transporter subunit IIA [Aerococcus urinaeequi]
MDLLSVIKEEVIFLNESFDSTDDLFKFIGEKTHALGLAKDSFESALGEREAVYPTGLQLDKIGVAIPHSDAEHINEEFISVVTVNEPVVFKSMDDANKTVDVSIIFVLGLRKAEDQLATLQAIMQVIQDPEVLDRLLEANSNVEVLDILKKGE